MKLSELGEFGLIGKIRKFSPQRSARVQVGIGDDAAVLVQSPNTSLLATTDMLIEGVHFDLAFTDFYSLGWKSAAVNLSDIAAMGGVPRFCLTSLGISPSITVKQITEFYRGCNDALRSSGAVLVGGDTCASRQGLTVAVTLLGESQRKNVLTRSGARPGDRIFVTGPLGDSAAGLELLKAGVRSRGAGVHMVIQKHLRPDSRTAWGRRLALSRSVHAMIDVSDGLSSDLGHLCRESRVGAVLFAEKIPLSSHLASLAPKLAKKPLHYALSGGEDYELLFAAPPARTGKLRSLGIPLFQIGEITQGRSLFIIGSTGVRAILQETGYNHFPS